jgi:multiple sugar transport system substrate-binding protein
VIRLRAVGWDHPRCMDPMRATAHAYRAVRPDVEVMWVARSGASFAYEPLEAVVADCDLVSYDHPHVGSAAQSGWLAPLDDLLAAETLDELARDSIGLSHESYAWAGRQWGLATDAAAQVSVLRPDLLGAGSRPATWDDALQLAREAPGRVTTSLAGADVLCSLLTLCANRGTPIVPTDERFADPDVALPALEWLAQYARHCHPTAYAGYVVGPMSTTDEILFGLLQWGYTDMAREGFTGRPLRFADIPSAGLGPVGSTLGGAGLGVSSSSEHPREAAEFAAWATGTRVQADVVFANGGQPGSRAAWHDPVLDGVAGGFFSATLATLEGAALRPRDPWFPMVQQQGGAAIAAGLQEGSDPPAILDALERTYRIAREHGSSHTHPTRGSA